MRLLYQPYIRMACRRGMQQLCCVQNRRSCRRANTASVHRGCQCRDTEYARRRRDLGRQKSK